MTNDSAVLEALKADAQSADTSPDWPGQSWQRLREAGVLAWSVPKDFGGAGWSALSCLPVTNNWPGHV